MPSIAESAAPLGLYVHLPWCLRKCPYCDFNSHAVQGDPPVEAYTDALLRDLALAREEASGRPVASLFFGGGTPNLFPAAQIARVIEAAAALFALPSDVEITLEANPGAAQATAFRDLRAAGVNRLSIGVQSLRDDRLAALGRVHDAAAARAAITAARAAGFDNVNIDLMYGLPGDDARGSLSDLDGVLAFAPEHLSWYQLALEPGTPFYRRPPPLPDEDTIAAIEAAGHARLAEAGLARYEVSAWARPGRQCRHNRGYWEFRDYLGIGAGAHGKTSRGYDIVRSARLRAPAHYMRAAGTPACVRREPVEGAGRRTEEFLLNALRLLEGFAPADFEARTGVPRRVLDAALAPARRRGLVATAGGRVRATASGLRFLDEVLAGLPPAPEVPAVPRAAIVRVPRDSQVLR